MIWAVELSATAEKELRRLPRDRRARIDAAIDEMERDPLAGEHEWKGHSRKRVGPYRIIFTMDRNTMTVAISAILIRSEKTYR